MKHLRITGNARSGSYTVAVMGQSVPGAAVLGGQFQEDAHDTVMQILRLRLRWQIIDQLQSSTFDYSFPYSF